MQRLDLQLVNHNAKVGTKCPDKEPNIKNDTLFYFEGELVGFFIREIEKFNPKISALADLANAELRSSRVPKSIMDRNIWVQDSCKQYSCIIGSIPPKNAMRRGYPSKSSVHMVESAAKFIKSMTILCRESEDLIAKLSPNIFSNQIKLIEENVPEKFRFGRMFTSSISNYNIAADIHIDKRNIPGCVNIIITKRFNADGGNLHVPDFDLTIDSANNSMLVYPAWRNLHGVTPIKAKSKDGYRNSLIFYPLKDFKNL